MVDTKDQLDTNYAADDALSVQKLATDIRDSVQRVIVGKSETIDIAVLSLLCRGPVSYTHLTLPTNREV